MSRGSTFTLYRAYNNFRATKKQISSIKAEYYKYNKKHDYFGKKDLFTGKDRTKEEINNHNKKLREDIPEILDVNFSHENEFSDRGQFENLDDFRKNTYTNFILMKTGEYMDKLLEWNFTSGFDCLINEYGLNYYTFKDNSEIIDKQTATEMLLAIEYLLGGNYDDRLELSMNNRFIKIFSDGNNCDSYWKYINRKKFDKNRTKYVFENESGVIVNVSIPLKDTDGEEDDYCEFEESNRQQEYYMRNVANALRAFLESDEWTYSKDSHLVLVYSCWG